MRCQKSTSTGVQTHLHHAAPCPLPADSGDIPRAHKTVQAVEDLLPLRQNPSRAHSRVSAPVRKISVMCCKFQAQEMRQSVLLCLALVGCTSTLGISQRLEGLGCPWASRASLRPCFAEKIIYGVREQGLSLKEKSNTLFL